ncbi:nucleotide exchange factor GrpE [Arthrobacter sp. zg-Y820]|uniref:nucleotide exchange factor GrpE n=1 Tax=unclassified Arthrobacter TaxID=235627 RepID=UPI001E5E6175|nr:MULTISPECIES: nucleotide exchange factor GrpE [unclassified Arthrobacter]MCC9197015.1 nucleotide exchange factor GrpE [Arthrobacter sp. zg-Y820]MDK1279880.1 nucleotide exchange factor GrpE [Arthrobacter sp. zg.Y820]MDK1360026.1 nucleotide exchange factor GrpE [Arthrobacter sp. zg-Y1219]WIB09185.1 nucleotide exchange factor GrpE [Arthrobacter sp. zg-Y820]
MTAGNENPNEKSNPEDSDPAGQQPAESGDSSAAEPDASPEAQASEENSGAEGDALAQAEQILNSAGVPPQQQEAGSPEAAELRNDLLRLQAEYVNYRRRVERDRDVAREMAVIGVLNSVMPVLDDIDAARQHGDLAEGPFASIATKLENTLKTYGLTRIDEVGVEFDPNIHEALIQQQSPDVQFDAVTQILRAGYKANDRVLRAAQVIVSVPEQ